MTRRRATARDLCALDEYNDGIERARRAYRDHPTTPRATTCSVCDDRRTESASGVCAACRKDRT